MYEDMQKSCKDCGNLFTITAGEQKFFDTNSAREDGSQMVLPKRCKDCRAKKKLRYENNGH